MLFDLGDDTDTLARNAARLLQGYSKQYAAGAFATPTRKELAAHPESVQLWGHGDDRWTIAVTKTLTRDSIRRDFTGAPFTLPKGARVVTHIARQPGSPIPDLRDYDYVMAYVEDHELAAALSAQGRPVKHWRVTAASELIGVWARPGETARLAAHDQVTVARPRGWTVPQRDRPVIESEVAAVTAWHDDFPYYSDGSWSAVSLRGFKPDDPQWGVKPSEMPRQWQLDHPEAMRYRCAWTVLADKTPRVRELVESVEWWHRLERVRLLQMGGRGGKGGKLDRHTDITDRDGGTRDGQIVRFHIPIVTHPAIVMHTWDLTGHRHSTHLEAWRVYYLDARKPHAVTNPTGVNRVHLVVDVVADEYVRRHIRDAAALA